MTDTDSRLHQRLVEKYEAVKPLIVDTIDELLTPTIISTDEEERTAVFAYRFHSWMKNGDGVMHGGYITCLMDSALGYFAGIYQPGSESTPTISLHVSFLNPVLPEDSVYIRAKVEDVKSRIVFMSGSMYLGSAPDRTLVTASGQYYRRSVVKE